jgi:hypothetical protein
MVHGNDLEDVRRVRVNIRITSSCDEKRRSGGDIHDVVNMM